VPQNLKNDPVPDQALQHRPRSLQRIVVYAAGEVTVTPLVVVEDALAGLLSCLGDATR
jgi:hypothetical protein